MILTEALHLLDANVLIARVFERHVHHGAAKAWFQSSGVKWALCPFTETGFLRYATAPGTGMGNLSMGEAVEVLDGLTEHPGYRYWPLSSDWRTLTKPFFRRLHGYRQVTDAYLLGEAVQSGLVLTTFDSAIVHLAGEYQEHVHLLGAK